MGQGSPIECQDIDDGGLERRDGKENHIRISFVNLCALGQLAIRFQASRLIGAIFENDIALLILIVP